MKTSWKDIPVFISSTFNDMHAERDYLVKFVFPELADWCSRRKLRLNDIDLRWGVTAEDSRTKRTVGICLRGIDESRPFFLGFLGQRRGWQPTGKDIDEKTFHEYPELASRIETRSVTEMEIEHALLEPLIRLVEDEPSRMIPAKHAFIFLRENTFSDQLNDAQKMIYTNRAEAKEGEDPASSPSVLRADEDVELFRKRLEEKAGFTRHYQADFDPQLPSLELGGMETDAGRGRLTNFRVEDASLKEVIIECLKKAILEEYPDRAEEIDESSEDEARLFFEERMAEGYIEQPESVEKLEEYLASPDRNVMVLYAPSGRGKTTLLCAYAGRLRKKGEWRVLLRSCGSGPDTSGVLGVFDSIFRELSIAPPLEIGELKAKIAAYLDMLAQEKTVLILDALDQIPDGEDVLRFLPGVLPENLKIICSIRQSILTGDLAPSRLASREILVYEVPTFTSLKGKQALVNGYLETHFKKLGEEEQKRLFEKKGSSNPLYLKAALSELRLLGRNSMLLEQIDSFGDEPEDIFDVLLARMENDMATEEEYGDKMVSWLFVLFACSRYGLEQDILFEAMYDLMPDADEEVIRSVARVCQRQQRDFLIQFGLLTDMRYYAFRNAAEHRYSHLIQRAHSALAKCFLSKLGLTDILNLRLGISKIENEFVTGSARDYTEAIYHLLSAREPFACTLLNSVRFMRGMLRCCGIGPLIESYDAAVKAAYLRKDKISGLRDIGTALKNSGYILQRCPWELEGQLSLRLSPKTNRQFLQDMKDNTSHAWVRVLKREGSAQFHVIEKSDAAIVCMAKYRDALVLSDREGRVRLLSLPDGKEIRTILHRGSLIRCACVRDACIYLGDENGWLYCYSLETGALLQKRAVFESAVTVLTCSDRGVYAADKKGKVAKVDPATLDLLSSCGFGGGVSSMFCDGESLYLGGRNGKVRRCSADRLKTIRTYSTHMGILTALYADREYLYAGGFSESISCIDLKSGKYYNTDFNNNDICVTQIIPMEGRIVCFSGFSARTYEPKLQKMKQLSGLTQSVRMTCADGDNLIFVTKEDQIGFAHISSFMPDKEEQSSMQEQGDQFFPAHPSANSPAYEIVDGDRKVLFLGENHQIRLYDKKTGKTLITKEMKDVQVASACYLPSMKSFVLGRMSGRLSLLDEAGGIRLLVDYEGGSRNIVQSDDPVEKIACSDRQIVFLRSIFLFHIEVKENAKTKHIKLSDIDALLVVDDRAYIASGKTVIIYDLTEDKEISRFQILRSAGKMMIRDGVLFIATQDGFLFKYDAETGMILGGVLSGKLQDFDLSENRICVASAGGSVYLYRGDRAQTSLTLDDPPSAVCLCDSGVLSGSSGSDCPRDSGVLSGSSGGDCPRDSGLIAGTYGGDYLHLKVENEESILPEDHSFSEGVKALIKKKAEVEFLKNQNIALVLNFLIYVISVICVFRGDMISNAIMTNPRLRGNVIGEITLVIFGLFFFARFTLAYDERKFRSTARILPAAFMLMISSVIFMVMCTKCMAVGDYTGPVRARIAFVLPQLLLFVYTLIPITTTLLGVRMIGWVDRWLEPIVNMMAGVLLIAMIAAALLV